MMTIKWIECIFIEASNIFFYGKLTLRMKLIWINLINIICIRVERLLEIFFRQYNRIASHRIEFWLKNSNTFAANELSGSSSFKCYVRYYHKKEMIKIGEMTMSILHLFGFVLFLSLKYYYFCVCILILSLNTSMNFIEQRRYFNQWDNPICWIRFI